MPYKTKILAQYAAASTRLWGMPARWRCSTRVAAGTWRLRLAAGGIIVFPHTSVADCGHQVAAAVHAALDSGADRVLVISVLHAFTPEMEEARVAVAERRRAA